MKVNSTWNVPHRAHLKKMQIPPMFMPSLALRIILTVLTILIKSHCPSFSHGRKIRASCCLRSFPSLSVRGYSTDIANYIRLIITILNTSFSTLVYPRDSYVIESEWVTFCISVVVTLLNLNVLHYCILVVVTLLNLNELHSVSRS